MLLNQTVVLIFFGFFFLWLAVLSVLFFRLFRHYRKLTKGVTKKDLKSVLENILSELEGESEKVKQIVKEIENFKKENQLNFQKIGFVRYNPFAETGGDQSFCLSLLDGNGSGLVISSLHSRDTTRVYAKPVKKNKAAGYELSEEEKEAIKKAKKIK